MAAAAATLATALVWAPACDDDCPDLVTVRDRDGGLRAELCVERARSEDERRRGLAGRAGLGARAGLPAGLLIAFPLEGEVCITNAPVSFALDVAFAARDGALVRVDRGVPPGDPTLRCAAPVQSVLETEAGVLDAVDVGHVLDDPGGVHR